MVSPAESPRVLPTAELDDARVPLGLSTPTPPTHCFLSTSPPPPLSQMQGPEQGGALFEMRHAAPSPPAKELALFSEAPIYKTPCSLQQLLEGYLADTDPGRGGAEARAHRAEAEGGFLALQSSVPGSLLCEAHGVDGSGELSSDLSEPDPPESQLQCLRKVREMGASCGVWISSIPRDARPATAGKKRAGTQAVPRDCGPSKRLGDAPTNRAAQGLEEGERHQQRARKRGRGSRRPRAGQATQEQRHSGPMGEGRMGRLRVRTFRDSEAVLADSFSVSENGLASSTGWQGRAPPKKTQRELEVLHRSGGIVELLKVFYPVPYLTPPGPRREHGATFVDRDGCVFIYRSFRAHWLPALAGDLSEAIWSLLHDTLSNRVVEERHRGALRGSHYPCIIGHCRQYQKNPELTAFHKLNRSRVEEFIRSPVVLRIARWVEFVARLVFPGVADRFDRSAKWYKKHRGIVPLFGLYWNLCINAAFPGQPRVHCAPHADRKNIVGICTLMVYELPGACFNHTQRSWLVVWEAGVVIELPPWVLLLHPSSLLCHFSIDVADIQFVATDGRQRPTPENSRPLEEGDEHGRGSLVFFNQATMYQSPETNCPTLQEAVKAGGSGLADYGKSAQEVFTKYAKYAPVQRAEQA